jgi:hypothetical protein
MSSYEIRIKEVHDSVFAIGDSAKAEGNFGPQDHDDMAEALRVLLGIVSKYTDPSADEVLNLACAARVEINAAEPDKAVFRRLVAATRKMMDELGSRIIEAGALAEAVAKIGDLIRHP